MNTVNSMKIDSSAAHQSFRGKLRSEEWSIPCAINEEFAQRATEDELKTIEIFQTK